MGWLVSVVSLISIFPHAAYAAASFSRRTVTSLSVQDVNSFIPLIQLAQAPYCANGAAQTLMNWKCGKACEAVPTFQPSFAGGDGGDVQFFVTGFWPERNQIVLSYEGTEISQVQSLLADLDVTPDPLDTALFPGLPAGAKVHGGFLSAFKASSDLVFPAIQKLIEEKGTKNILVGHSLGGATAQLAAVHLALTVPGSNIELFTLGLPRVGNPEWAQSVTAKVPNNTRVNYKKDVVPTIPGRRFGFAHPAGEVHLLDDNNTAVYCDGVDSTEKNCMISTVPNILLGNIFNHVGPYVGIKMGKIAGC
ncbi:Alpha/Beta hydrolase protein [Flagelloscypha sp. PMI_526]|nr:Alpha/Beta hydrolase protein [Flagelloscypha sp. PMI_526]